MKKLFILLGISLLLSGCRDTTMDRQSGSIESYRPVKICPIADKSQYHCVEHRAKRVSYGSVFVVIVDLDGNEYWYNHAGWSITVSQRVVE